MTAAQAPLIHRDDLVRDQLSHPPLGSRRLANAGSPVRAGVTGSGDNLFVLAWSAAELERERAAGVRLFSQLGITPGTRVANALPGALETPGSLLLGDVVQDLDGLDIPVGSLEGDAAAKQAWTLIDLVEPHVLVLNARSAAHLFAGASPASRPWWQGIVWLRKDSDAIARPSLPPATGFEGWQRVWLAAPEATNFVAVSCTSGRFHLDRQVGAEIVDLDGDGDSRARIALAARGFETAEMRYVSGFRGSLPRNHCPCGVTGATLKLDDE